MVGLVCIHILILHYSTIKKLLPLHASYMQCEETGAKVIQRHKHRGDHLRGNSQSPMRKAHGNPNAPSEANAVSL